jgi:pimeloyl-ACP methyl ester carboxylesterase
VSDAPSAEDLVTLFFEQTATSQARGQEFIDRLGSRREDRDAPVSAATRDAHLSAIATWGIPDPTRLNRLAGISQPTLVANGDNDSMVPTRTPTCWLITSPTPDSASTRTPATVSSSSTRSSSAPR